MKYAMKMVLIPESEYRRLKPEGGMKDKVDKILSGKRDAKAATEMSQLFGRYLRTTKPVQPSKKPIEEMEIVSHLPVLYHEKVSKFLTQLQNYGTTWTDNYQLISKSGEVIGDIVDLLKEAFVGTRRTERQIPSGWIQFIKEIVNANISRKTFSKKTTRDDIQQEIEERGQFHKTWENY